MTGAVVGSPSVGDVVIGANSGAIGYYDSQGGDNRTHFLNTVNGTFQNGEVLNKNVRQLGCPSCKNTFKLDALENWLNIHYRCPFCSSTNEFFLV